MPTTSGSASGAGVASAAFLISRALNVVVFAPVSSTTASASGASRLPPAVRLVVVVAVAVAVYLLVSTAAAPADALDNGLARTPPMGWLAWQRFTCETDCVSRPNDCIGERLFDQMSERLVADGYAKLGYTYVNIDDCWSELARDPASNKLRPNRARFPNGLRHLADKVHARGLKLGLYGDCGERTCANYPAQLGPRLGNGTRTNTFQLDAQTFATDWHIDSFKFDGCHIEADEAERVCPLMASALANTNRQVMLICEWPFYLMYARVEPDWQLAASSCNVWRYYDDIEDSWSSVLNTIDYTVEHQATIVKYHGPGHWFDPDQLVVGNFGLSWEQARAQMAIWSIWSAPLYMSVDLRSIEPEMGALLRNERMIEVNQDPFGVFGLMTQQSADHSLQAFVKPVRPVAADGCPSFAIVYLNRNSLGGRAKVSFRVRDLLAGAPIRQAARNQRSAADDDDDARRRPIELGPCTARLRAQAHAGPAFGLEDLLGDNAADEALGVPKRLDDRLELWVNPSGVRAVKLTQWDLSYWHES